MNIQKDGGPAFPQRHEIGDGAYIEYSGLTIRDYFAAKAMQALVTSPYATQEWIKNYAATSAYQVADSMLRAREERKS